MAGGHGGGGNRPAQVLIVVVLILIVFGLHWVDTPQLVSGFNSGSLLAFGFVVLASYTIGKLAPVIKIPHITGYLLAGMVFGPSIPELIEGATQSGWFTSLFGNIEVHLLPPFDRGIIDNDTVGFLSILDTLAIALIALTAGGELKIEALKKGLNSILGALIGQTLLIFLFITPLVWAITGGIPAISLPGVSVPTMVGVGLGLVISVISVATSPAATIAVINEQGAEGPVTRTVLPAVVMKDIIVVVGYSLASLFALTQMGQGSDQNIGSFLLIHIGGSLAVGAALGWLLALYLQYVGKEVLLVIIGVVYAATLMASALHQDPMLVFLAAGFTASNFSREGDNLIHNVERLSMPVYVVFFTLAGAKLHLLEVISYFGYAAALVGLRILAIWLGVKLGTGITNSPQPVRKYAWLGFLSQAGVAISLASLLSNTFGEVGATLQTVLIAGIAINEIVGPVLLEKGLQLSGEAGKRFRDQGEEESEEEDDEEGSEGVESELQATERISVWPDTAEYSPWGTELDSRSEALSQEYSGFSAQLEAIVLGAAKGPIRRFHMDAQDFVRELRRDFLRHHRRLAVGSRTDAENLIEEIKASESKLVMRWRGTVLHRAEELHGQEWNPAHLVETLDRIVESAPAWIKVPYEPQSYRASEGEGVWVAVGRTALKARRLGLRMFGSEPKRGVPFRALARYHFSGATPQRLESVAMLLVRAEDHLTRRMREILKNILQDYARLVEGEVGSEDLEELRGRVDHEFQRAQDEVDRIGHSLSGQLTRVFGDALADLRDDLMVAGTFDLKSGARRSSRVFHDRIKAIHRLEADLPLLRESLGGGYALLSLELELRELEAVLRNLVTDHTLDLSKALRGKGFAQADKTQELLNEALEKIKDRLTPTGTVTELGDELKEVLAPLERRARDAAALSSELHEQFMAEEGLGTLVEAMRAASHALSERYSVPNGHLEFIDDTELPRPTSLVEVRFRELVLGLTESSIGPELVTAAADMGTQVVPLSTTLSELERVISIKSELVSAELEVLDGSEEVSESTVSLINDVIFQGLERTQDALTMQVASALEWPRAFPSRLRSIVSEEVESLHSQLSGGEFDPERSGNFVAE